MSTIEKVAARIVREQKRIDRGKSNGRKLKGLVRWYLALQRAIDRMPA